MIRIGVAGAGNVGSALVMALAGNIEQHHEVIVASRDIRHAEAAILDAASAYPRGAARFVSSAHLTGHFDITIITAGLQPHGDISLNQLLCQNMQIATEYLSQTTAKNIVVIGTPVDRLAEKLSGLTEITHGAEVIGFGGQLDVARLQYALIKHGSDVADAYVVGEHGPRAIPVYPGEQAYADIRQDTTTVLKRISAATGKARNLATGVQLAQLVEALLGNEQVLCISAANSHNNGLFLTWPHVVNELGIGQTIDIPDIGPQATQLLQDLVAKRLEERASV